MGYCFLYINFIYNNFNELSITYNKDFFQFLKLNIWFNNFMQAYSVFWAHLFTTTSQPFPTHINTPSSLQILAHRYPCLVALFFALFCDLMSVTTIVHISLMQSYPQEHRGLTRQWLLLPQRASAAYSTQEWEGTMNPLVPTTWVHCAAVMLSPGPCFTPLLINIWLYSFLYLLFSSY